MHPLRPCFDLYACNYSELEGAIAEAGGGGATVLATEEFREVLAVLAANHISIEAYYLGEKIGTQR